MSMLPPTTGEPSPPTNPLPAANPEMTQLPPSQNAPGSKSSLSSIAWLIVALTGLLLVLTCAGLALLASSLLPRGQTIVPSPTPTPPVVSITSIKKIAELATVEAGLVTDVEVANVPDEWWNLFDAQREKLVMIVHGTAKAGFDLEKIRDEDLWTDGTRVQLTLPSPELLSFELDLDKSRIVAYDRSVLMSMLETDKDDLQAEALAIAQERLKQSVQESNILPTAEEYGRVYFENHLRSLGFEDVRIEFR